MESIDNHSNTLLHLAVLNELNLESFELLLKKVDFKLFQFMNDEGYTVLHEAVRLDYHQHVYKIIQIIEQREFPQLQRVGNGVDVTKLTKADFAEHYSKVCENINPQLAKKAEQSKIKRQLLDAVDLRGGNTALFMAIESKKGIYEQKLAK